MQKQIFILDNNAYSGCGDYFTFGNTFHVHKLCTPHLDFRGGKKRYVDDSIKTLRDPARSKLQGERQVFLFETNPNINTLSFTLSVSRVSEANDISCWAWKDAHSLPVELTIFTHVRIKIREGLQVVQNIHNSHTSQPPLVIAPSGFCGDVELVIFLVTSAPSSPGLP